MLGGFEVAAQHPTYSRVFYYWIDGLAERRGVGGEHLLAEMAWSALLGAPHEWVANAWTHYTGLWLHASIYGADIASSHAALLEELDDTPLTREVLALVPVRPRPTWLVQINSWATAMSVIASVAVIGLAVWLRLRRTGVGSHADVFVAALAALTVHGYFMLTAVFATYQIRYSTAMWPFEALYGALLVHWMLGQKNLTKPCWGLGWPRGRRGLA